MWGEKFEESIKEKRKLLGGDRCKSSTPVPRSKEPTEGQKDAEKTLPKSKSAADMDMFAEHTDIFSSNFDVSFHVHV